MMTPALRLAIVLQAFADDAQPWILEPATLQALSTTIDETGGFQQRYAALVDVTNPALGTVDATVEVSAAQLEDGTPVIVFEDDEGDGSARFLVLQAQWQGFPAGTLLQGRDPAMAVVTRADDDASGMRAQALLGSLELLKMATPQRDRSDLQAVAHRVPDDLPGFLAAFTASTAGEPVDGALLDRWQGRLPDTLLALWQRDGLARYLEDRLMLVDPERYSATLAPLLVNSRLEGIDTFHAFAVTAFGQVFVCGENTAVEIIADPYTGAIQVHPSMLAASDADERNGRLRFLLTLLEPEELDVTDMQGDSVYAMTRDRLGPLAADDVYTPGPEGLVEGWETRLIRQDAFKAWEWSRHWGTR